MIYFIGAGPGDPDLVTVKAQKILQIADAVLFTGSLVPKEVLSWCKKDAIIEDSQGMKYPEIFDFLLKHKDKIVARVHTGDPSIYSTIAKQIEFLKEQNIEYKVIPGITAAFGAASSLGIEYTIPGVSQTLILSRIEGKTPNPEKLEKYKKTNQFWYFIKNIKFIEHMDNHILTLSLIKGIKEQYIFSNDFLELIFQKDKEILIQAIKYSKIFLKSSEENFINIKNF